MSLSNIGISSSPDVQQLKKNILYNALQYNIHEQQTKTFKKHLQKQREIQQYKLINRRVSTQLNQQLAKAKDKKNYIKNILANDYQKQISEKKYYGLEEMKKDRSYAQAQQERQKEYYERRSREMARILNAQRTLQAVNPETEIINRYENQQKRTRTLQPELAYESVHQPSSSVLPKQSVYKQPQQQQQQQPQPQSNLISQPNLSYQPQPKQSLQTDQSQSRISNSYKDYLMYQIQRKKNQRQEQLRYKMQKQKEFVKNNTQLLQKEKQQLKQIQRKQKQAFKKSLDDQVLEKANFKRYL